MLCPPEEGVWRCSTPPEEGVWTYSSHPRLQPPSDHFQDLLWPPTALGLPTLGLPTLGLIAFGGGSGT